MLKFSTWLKDLIYPAHIKCIFCGEELDMNTVYDTCTTCFDTLPFIINECPRCGQHLLDGSTEICSNCKQNNFYFDYARAVFDYDDMLVNVVHELKYSHSSYLVPPLVNYMLNKLSECDFNFDLITFVPIHKNRLKERGYNQAQLLAEQTAIALGMEAVSLCEKIVDSVSQTTLSREQRKQNVEGTYRFSAQNGTLDGKNVLLIDDIFTSGATSNEVARVLKEHGANKVFVLTLAHTLDQSNMENIKPKSLNTKTIQI